MIAHVTRLGLQIGFDHEIEAARMAFADSCAIHVKSFLDAELVADLQHRLAAAAFARRVHDGVEGVEPPVDMVLKDHGIASRMLFLLNDEALFRVVRRITGCDSIGCFTGTIFKMMARDGQFDSWHSDVDDNRMVALSVNLGERPFEGGVLEIKEAKTERILWSMANGCAGDAMLFEVSRRLLHKVTDVTGDVSRVVLAGWFQRTPRYASVLPRVPAAAGAMPS